MPFKIVQTQEKGLNQLCIVPSGWESRGILYWPPKNLKTSKLVNDEQSIPGPSWRMMPCILKRKNLASYQDADIELTIMEECTDTDNPISAQSVMAPFEAFAEDLCPLQPSEGGGDPGAAGMELCNMEKVLANQTEIMKRLDFLLENQKNITLKVASLSVQIQESQSAPINVTLLKDVMPEENESFSITPINSALELEEFENALNDKVYRKKNSKLLSMLCSAAEGQGTTCAYKLLDAIITREFLCQISWSGGSKGETAKIPLKTYKNFQKFFCGIVHNWDSSFSIQDYEKFFKIVLRNAVKRKSMKNLRTSTKRVRKQPKENTAGTLESAVSPTLATCPAPVPIATLSPITSPEVGDAIDKF